MQSWYDTYGGLPADFDNLKFSLSSSDYWSEYSFSVVGLLTAQEVRVLNPEVGMRTTLKSMFYYDPVKGRLIQTNSQRYDFGNIIQSYKHNFLGQVVQEQIRLISKTESLSLERRMSYDHAGRVTLSEQRTDANPWIKVSVNEYDALSRNTTQKLGVEGGNVVQELNNTYNIRGWLTAINNPDNLGTDLFAMRLNYQNQALSEERQYTGNITETDWAYRNGNPGDLKRMAYRYAYDGLNRLTDGKWYNNGVRESDKFDTKYEYDLQGNIKNLNRYGISGTTNALIDNLGYTYDGNRLQGVIDNSGKEEGYRDINKTSDFFYNANGSMYTDLDKGIKITYNLLNLPQKVNEIGGNNSVNYIYTATGQKLAVLYLNGNVLNEGNRNRYIGPLVQRYDHRAVAWANDYILTAEGRLVYKGGTTWVPQYFLKDHLGNTRSIVEKSTSYSSTTGWAKQVWQANYYPFGMTLGQTYIGENNQLGYNGKEKQDFALNGRALDWVDYGARFYDPQIGRWHVIDAKSEKYSSWSHYNYCMNNPILLIDLDGNDWYQSNEGAVFWRNSNDKQITYNDVAYKNIGANYSLKQGNTTYNYEQDKIVKINENTMSSNGYVTEYKSDAGNNPILGADGKPTKIMRCFQASFKMAENSRAKPLGGFGINQISTASESGTVDNRSINPTNNARNGVAYAESEIGSGRAVVAGVDFRYGYSNDKQYGDFTTDHYITIKNVTYDLKYNTTYFGYYDPGTYTKGQGTSSGNVLKVSNNSLIVGQAAISTTPLNYTVISIQKNN